MYSSVVLSWGSVKSQAVCILCIWETLFLPLFLNDGLDGGTFCCQWENRCLPDCHSLVGHPCLLPFIAFRNRKRILSLSLLLCVFTVMPHRRDIPLFISVILGTHFEWTHVYIEVNSTYNILSHHSLTSFCNYLVLLERHVFYLLNNISSSLRFSGKYFTYILGDFCRSIFTYSLFSCALSNFYF